MPLHIVRQNLAELECDALVNPTNSQLTPGGGVDAALHAGAGPELLAACQKLGGCPVGEVRLTPGFGLKCNYVIHTVGPRWQGGQAGEQTLLENCYRRALVLAEQTGCQSIAFPLISSGTHGYPKDRVLKVAVQAIRNYLQEREMTVYLAVYDKKSYQFSEKLYAELVSYIDENLEEELQFLRCTPRIMAEAAMPAPKPAKRIPKPKIELDESFAEALFRLIDQRGMTDVECYKKANVDKKTFSKIKCNPAYRPGKITAVSFAIALELSLEETEHLLRTVGFSLSHSNVFDLIIEYYISHGIYDIFEINEALFEFDQVCLG